MIKPFETIIRQRCWNDPKNDKGLVKIMENIEARLSKRLPRGAEFSLTTFQKKAIAHEKFWRCWDEDSPVEHLVVQGATSAGKTLLSELNILDTLQHGQKAIVLVPLKAMVHERTEQFRHDMFLGKRFQVYGASSDHMENDERLINGEYDVAIIVYEKFFSMLSQGSARIMDRCGLLVVDELSMLSRDQRGPKLEMALEIVRGKHPDTRIMCLATCDCSTEKICQWLQVSEPIVSTARPVPLEEHILQLDGEGIFRYIPADHELEQDEPPMQEEKLEIPGYRSDWRIPQKKKGLLLAVIGKIFKRTPDARLLIFVSSQADTINIAHFLRESAPEWFPASAPSAQTQEQKEFLKRINTCDRDDGQAELIDSLIPHGIAYHHAGISTTLRELIEEEFQKPESVLKVIVATETLTVGVNMPFDAMIMVSNVVPRGMGQLVPLSMQEYRNYIGRAGRLGQNNRSGETYLFVENAEDMRLYWNSYYNRDEVTSALTKATEKERAPYYLSLLTNQVGNTNRTGTTFTDQQLRDIFNTSLSRVCATREPRFSPTKLYEHLYDAYLSSEVRAAQTMGRGAREQERTAQRAYAVDHFGTHMAPYALSTETCIKIYWYFYEGYLHGGLPLGIQQEDVDSDRYLLDILYHVCRHDEIAATSSLIYPMDDRRPDRSAKAKKLVLQQLQKILSEEDENGKRRYVLWCEGLSAQRKEENDLWLLTNRTNLPDETVMLQAALRAILLFYWTQGKTVPQIKDITNFHEFTKVINGDIERLAELVSFHLDAIYKCLSTAQTTSGDQVCATPEALNAFYALQTRVKYGMPRDLVQFANKHIYGLDRSRLLRLKEQADRANRSPIQYLYLASSTQLQHCLTPTHQAQLLQALERRGSVREFDTLMEIVSKDASTELTSGNSNCLKAIAAWDGNAPGALYQKLKALVNNDAFKPSRIGTDGDIHCVVWHLANRELCIGLLEKNCSDEAKANIKQFFRENNGTPRLIITPSRSRDEWDSGSIEQAMREFGCSALMDTTFLAMILANTIRVNLENGAALYEFLADARGIFTKYEYSHFSLANYIRREKESSGPPSFRLICGNNKEAYSKSTLDIGELKIALSKTKDLQNFEILPWGSELMSGEYTFCDCPTVILLEREQITRSDSLNKFIYKMRQQRFDNCLLLLDSEAAEQAWNSKENLEQCGCIPWNNQYTRIRKVVTADPEEAVQSIRDLLGSWEHQGYLIGISYAHYDSQPRNASTEWKSDIDKLTLLANKLAEEYGEHRILFDQFSPAKDLFIDRGAERSLAAYAQCKLDLILWNYWTELNENCRAEREVINRQCEARAASCLYLQTGQPSDPEVPYPYFSLPLTDDPEDLYRTVRNLLRSYPD